jgi:hypothetical protein
VPPSGFVTLRPYAPAVAGLLFATFTASKTYVTWVELFHAVDTLSNFVPLTELVKVTNGAATRSVPLTTSV